MFSSLRSFHFIHNKLQLVSWLVKCIIKGNIYHTSHTVIVCTGRHAALRTMRMLDCRHLGLVIITVSVRVSALSPRHSLSLVHGSLVVWRSGWRSLATGSSGRQLETSVLGVSLVSVLTLLTRDTSPPQTWQTGNTAALRCQS